MALMTDYRGLKLCKPCWNTLHWHYAEVFKACKAHRDDPRMCEKMCPNGKFVKTSQVIIDCLRGECQCPCVALLNEKHPRVKPDYSAQALLFAEREGAPKGRTEREHRDEG